MERSALLCLSLQPDGSLRSLTSWARLISLSILVCSAAFGQGQGLSITNYQVVSTQTIQGTVNVTYRADLVNTGTALEAVTAIVTSLNPSIQVAAGQNTLQFAPVPANSQVTSSNTFTLQLVNNVPADLSQLQWTFQTAGILLPASVTVTPGDTVNFPVTLGTAAPAGGVYITLTSSNPSIAIASPWTFFISEGMTTARRVVTTVTGTNAGSATITASAPGYANANGQVLVSSGGTTATTMSFWPGSLTITGIATQNLTLNLSAPAPSELVVSLGSSNATVATVPATVSFGTGMTTVSVPVTGVAGGSVTITASATNMANATASVTVTQPAGIILPGNVTLAAGATVNFPITLGAAAPAGGVKVTLSSSDPSTATVSPSTFFVSEGLTTASGTVTTVTGNKAGSATITASAPGYATASGQVQVTGGGTTTSTTMSFSPGNLTINGIATQNLTLSLSAPAPAGLTITLGSSNVSVAATPATVSFGANTTNAAVPVTGVAAGSATITASAPNMASATAVVTVTQAAAGGILLPSSVTIAPGNTMNFPVTLGTAAPSGGVYITLASSDPSIVIASPWTFFISEGMTSARRVVTTVTGNNAGSATITASAFGYPTASAQVQVTGGGTTTTTTMSFSPGSLTLTGTATQNLALNLSTPAPAALVVNLSSSDSTVATVPAAVSFGAGATTVSVPVTGVAAGSVTITASAANIASATASVTVTQPAAGGAILLPASTTVGLNQSAAFQVTLPSPAPAGGVTVSLASSDTSTATVSPSVFIAARSTYSTTPPQVTGIKLGSASITASAPGFTPGTAQVVVTGGGGSSYFSPGWGLSIIAGSSQDLTLSLVPPAGGLTVSLSSSNPSVAIVPATVTSNLAGTTVTVTAVAPGSATITASTPNFGTATANIIVTSLNGVSVTWYGACWAGLTLYGYTGNFQGIDFALSTPTPVAVQGSLFFTANCDPSQGVDNMNDNGTLTGSTHMIQGFSHHPDVIPTSALYWIGNATSNGTCPPGSLCSGCVNYNTATPSCSTMP